MLCSHCLLLTLHAILLYPASSNAKFLIVQQLNIDNCTGVPNVTFNHLKEHQMIMTRLMTSEVSFGGRMWSFGNLCVRPDIHAVQGDFHGKFQRFMNRFPLCQYSSPLECYNEGGAVRGPHPPVYLSVLIRWILEVKVKYLHWQNVIPYDFLNRIQAVVAEFLPVSMIENVKDYLVQHGWKSGIGYAKKPCFDPENAFCLSKRTDFRTAVANCSGQLPSNIRNMPIYSQNTNGHFDFLISSLPIVSPEALMQRMLSAEENPAKIIFTVEQLADLSKRWFSKLHAVVAEFNSTAIVATKYDANSPEDILTFARAQSECYSEDKNNTTAETIPKLKNSVGMLLSILFGGGLN